MKFRNLNRKRKEDFNLIVFNSAPSDLEIGNFFKICLQIASKSNSRVSELFFLDTNFWEIPQKWEYWDFVNRASHYELYFT